MKPLANYAEDATVVVDFNVFDSNGEPGALTGTLTESVEIYKSGSSTPHTQAYTPSVLNSLTGVYRVSVDMSAHAFFETGKDYTAILTGAGITASGTAVTNTVLARWSCQNQVANVPDGTITANTFDAGVLATDADIADAVWNEPRADHTDADSFGEGVVVAAASIASIATDAAKKLGIPMTLSGTPTTTSLPVSDAPTGISTTQLDNALVLHLPSGSYSRITEVAGSVPNLTLTVSPAYPAAPDASDEIVVFGQYLASL